MRPLPALWRSRASHFAAGCRTLLLLPSSSVRCSSSRH
ncbi:MAG: hypothetical protein JO094_01500 [Hyphomicrobiales bacterium]|nr:hypothetical protein [Hyphomicrobiales bacterium]MBV8767546.1 hypothetical protein [Hyphomicrobiales bacterium]MBV9052601.1 hypothetical protein [Hyphomicrobiales bacterium]MBV9751527.1 hypothetical protein [Hyphomicrobiales bacterium]MBV9975910.1 hypothetical protein [Hyphomicrobiales bacterium]